MQNQEVAADTKHSIKYGTGCAGFVNGTYCKTHYFCKQEIHISNTECNHFHTFYNYLTFLHYFYKTIKISTNTKYDRPIIRKLNLNAIFILDYLPMSSLVNSGQHHQVFNIFNMTIF